MQEPYQDTPMRLGMEGILLLETCLHLEGIHPRLQNPRGSQKKAFPEFGNSGLFLLCCLRGAWGLQP